jgi:predicted nucleotide-binding protein (sugar kinase/HSP70/actin superfamily)
VGINGEIYLRANEFSNSCLVRACEAAGLEAMVSPMGEWMKYILHRHIEDAVRHREYKKALKRWLVRLVRDHDEGQVYRALGGHGESVSSILEDSRLYLSPRCGSEAVLSLGSGVCWMKSPHFAGAISVMPHGCMPGGIVASISEKISALHNKPWISLTYDGFKETNNLSRLKEFAELVKFQHNERV